MAVVGLSIALALLSACQDPTAPASTACLFVVHVPASAGFPPIDVASCYHVCPDSAEALAAARGQELVRGTHRC